MSDQIRFFQEIYLLTESLALVSADETPDPGRLHELLNKRQAIMDAVTQRQAASTPSDGEGCRKTENLQNEVFSILQKTAALEKTVIANLQTRRDASGKRLQHIQTEKKAGKAYRQSTPQVEGFYFDSKKN